MAADRSSRHFFKGYHPATYTAAAFITWGCWGLTMFLLSAAGYDNVLEKLWPVMAGVFLGVGLLLVYFPASWRADGEEVTITATLRSWHFRYSDIKRIEIVNCGARPLSVGGPTNVSMTVVCRSGKAVEFLEKIPYGAEFTSSYGDPLKSSVLMELCEYVNAAKGVEIL